MLETESYENEIVIDAYETLEHEISSLMPRLFTPMKCPKQTSVKTTPNGCTDLFKRASDSSITKDPTGDSEFMNYQFTTGGERLEKLMGSKISNFFKIARAEDEEFNRVVNSAFENTELSQDQINLCLSRYLFYTSMRLYEPIACMESLSHSNLRKIQDSLAFTHARVRFSKLYQDSFYASRETQDNFDTAFSKVKAITSSLISSSISPSSLAAKSPTK